MLIRQQDLGVDNRLGEMPDALPGRVTELDGLLTHEGAGDAGEDTRAGPGATLAGLVMAQLLYLAGYATMWRYLHPGGFFAV